MISCYSEERKTAQKKIGFVRVIELLSEISTSHTRDFLRFDICSREEKVL
jgi:hypothetical protein